MAEYSSFVPFHIEYRYFNVADSIVSNSVKTLLHYFKQERSISFILYGKYDTGKTSLSNAYLMEYYGLSSLDEIQTCEYIYKYNSLEENGYNQFKNNIHTFCKMSVDNIKLTIFIDDIDTINENYQIVIKDCMDKYKGKLNVIITCTQIEKIKELLKSRLYVLRLDSYTNKSLLYLLNKINNKHNLNIDTKTKTFIINTCESSLMRLFSILETIRLSKLHNNDICDIKHFKSICCFIDDSYFKEYTSLWLKERNISDSTNVLISIIDKGYSMIDILEMYLSYIKHSKEYEEEMKHACIRVISQHIIYFYCLHENDIETYLFTYDLMNPE